ncbi:MAG: hypothetical protein JST44_06885 [Cyanobacteria bacterium SZAS LIN-5]|nr:hypothetical protein [Cyanobacteria bacterium SZAS LIN-5]
MHNRKLSRIACCGRPGRITLIALLLLSLVKPLSAAATTSTIKMHSGADKRQAQSISEDWHKADAVCVGKLRRADGATGATLSVTEVLKGDQKLKGTTLEIPLDRYLAGIFPNDSNEKISLALFSRDPSSKVLVATELYDDADKISATRCLTSIFQSTSERQSLQALSEMVLDPSSRCQSPFKKDAKTLFRKEFLAALGTMHDKSNFSIVTNLYEKADIDTRHALLDWMACSGDRRSLPYLIAAVPSPDRSLRSLALSRLIYYYPGDVGVDECISDAYEHGFADTKNVALDYLSKRRGGASKTATQARPKTNYQKGEELYAAGKFNEAVPFYIQEILTNKSDPYARRWSALKAIPYASTRQKDEIRHSILPLVAEDALTGNYLEATDAAEILQKLEHIDCLDSMITLLDRIEPLFGKANRMAAFGISKLNGQARHKAASHLLERIKSEKFRSSNDQQSQLITLLELIWIADQQDLHPVDETLKGSGAQSIWSSLKPLLDKNLNRGALLTRMLAKSNGLPHLAKDWIIVELGDLKETAAADLILEHLKEMKFQYDYNVAGEALQSIGGRHVCNELEKLALGNDEVSRNAVDVLCSIEKEKCLPTLRKIINSKSIAKTNALNAMARMGTPQDLAQLLPLSDYWTGDRQYHYWTMEAIAAIRQRHGLNVDGPINGAKRTGKEKAPGAASKQTT